jgi:hypothetical protein
MRSIFVRVEPTVRPGTGALTLIMLNLNWVDWTRLVGLPARQAAIIARGVHLPSPPIELRCFDLTWRNRRMAAILCPSILVVLDSLKPQKAAIGL